MHPTSPAVTPPTVVYASSRFHVGHADGERELFDEIKRRRGEGLLRAPIRRPPTLEELFGSAKPCVEGESRSDEVRQGNLSAHAIVAEQLRRRA